MPQKRIKRMPQIDRITSKRAKIFLMHAREEKVLEKYRGSEKFLATFKPAFFRPRTRTFVVDIRKGFPQPHFQ